MSIEIIAKAKADLEAAGQQWVTDCDAYKITNLAVKRTPGWKCVEKTSGVNCVGRKVDGILAGGNLYDCMISAGPPANLNTPSWQLVGPQAALVPLDPLPQDDPASGIGPNPPDPPVPPNPEPEPGDVVILQALEDITATQAVHTQLLEQLRSQEAANTARVMERDDANTEKIQQQLHQIVEDMERTLKEVVALILISRPDDVDKIFKKKNKK